MTGHRQHITPSPLGEAARTLTINLIVGGNACRFTSPVPPPPSTAALLSVARRLEPPRAAQTLNGDALAGDTEPPTATVTLAWPGGPPHERRALAGSAVPPEAALCCWVFFPSGRSDPRPPALHAIP